MSEKVQGVCPSCGNRLLFLGSGGYVTCSLAECRKPDAASDLLEQGFMLMEDTRLLTTRVRQTRDTADLVESRRRKVVE